MAYKKLRSEEERLEQKIKNPHISISVKLKIQLIRLCARYPDDEGEPRTPSQIIEYLLKKHGEWKYIRKGEEMKYLKKEEKQTPILDLHKVRD